MISVQPKKMCVKLIVLFSCSVLSCKPSNNNPSRDFVQSSVSLTADPPPPKSYDPNDPVKFIATIIPNNTQAQQPGGVVKFTYDGDKEACSPGVPLLRLSDGNLQAVCAIDLKGGSHNVNAFYTGDEKTGYAPSVNVAKFAYTINQYKTEIASIKINNSENPTAVIFGDIIRLSARMDRVADMPPFNDGTDGTLEFSIALQTKTFFGLIKSKNAEKKICQTTAENDASGTTFYCDYFVQPNDFVTTPNDDKEPYTVIITANYNGSAYYASSSKDASLQIKKIPIKIQNIASNDNIYVIGKTVTFTGHVLGNNDKIKLESGNGIEPPKLCLLPNMQTLKSDQCKALQSCTFTNVDDQQTIACEYQIENRPDIIGTNKCFGIQYNGDRAHDGYVPEQQNSVCAQVTRLEQLHFSSTSAVPVYVGDKLIIKSGISIDKPKPDSPMPELKYLLLERSLDTQKWDVVHNFKDPTECVYDAGKEPNVQPYIFTCTYATQANDAAQQYSYRLNYVDSSTNPYYAANPENIVSTDPGKNLIQKIPVAIDAPNITGTTGHEYEINTVNTVKVSIHIKPFHAAFQVQPNVRLYKSLGQNPPVDITPLAQCALSSPSADETMQCKYTGTVEDYDAVGAQHVLTLYAAIEETDSNYAPIQSGRTSITIKTITGSNLLSLQATLQYPQKFTISGTLFPLSNVPAELNYVILSKKLDAAGNWQDIPPCTMQANQYSCDYIPEDDDKLHTSISFQAKYLSQYYSIISSESQSFPIQSTCVVSAENRVSVQDCDPDKACTLRFTCDQFTNSLPTSGKLHITNMTPSADVLFFPPYPDPDKPIDASKFMTDVDCTLSDDKNYIQCPNFAPITDKFSLQAELRSNSDPNFVTKLNINKIFVPPPAANKQDTFTKCGVLGGDNTERASPYTTLQRMFDCYQRVEKYAGFTDDNGNYVGPTVDPAHATHGDPKSWYLVSCPDSINKNLCSWLAPEIPVSGRVGADQSGTYSPQFADISATTSGNDYANIKPNYGKLLKYGQRILWSGVLRAGNRYLGEPFNFFGVNGVSSMPRTTTNSVADMGYHKMINNDELGGYGVYGCFSAICTSEDVLYSTWPLNPGSVGTYCISNNTSSHIFCSSRDDNLEGAHKKPTHYEWSYVNSQKTVQDDNVRGFGLLYRYPPDDNSIKHPYAYTDVCVRRANNVHNIPNFPKPFLPEKNDQPDKDSALIYSSAYDWHVPSYPMLLLLTGGKPNSPCEPSGEPYEKNQRAVCAKIKDEINPDYKGFRAIGPIPDFVLRTPLWSSSVASGYTNQISAFSSVKGWAFDSQNGRMFIAPLEAGDQVLDEYAVRCASMIW